MPNPSRIVDVRIARQQTKIAAETTNRYRVEPKEVMTLSITVCAPKKPVTASFMFGTAISTPHRKMAPITKAPTTEARTALGASRLGSRVSSPRVDAVSNP